MSNDIVWDIETFPNVFTLAAEHAWLPITWEFEISDWRNDSRAIIEFAAGLIDKVKPALDAVTTALSMIDAAGIGQELGEFFVGHGVPFRSTPQG